MKILHLYSDWKWTGPAEPVLQMCRGLQDLGHEVLFAHTRDEFEDAESVSQKVVEYGVNATTRFALDRHFPVFRSLRDTVTLPRFVKAEAFDVVHMHLTYDHSFSAVFMRMLLRDRPLLVRTFHKRAVIKNTFTNRLLVRHLMDAGLTFTEGFRSEYCETFGLDRDTMGVQPMTVDLKRFRPDRTFRDMRAELGIPASAPVVGIVARFQKYRKMDVFLTAAKQVLEQEPEARFVVIGRSSQIQETVLDPMRELGISDRVILTGYRIDDYDDILASLDIFSLLVPGFDGTARAVREAMALGKPCVTSDFGMLPDIVPHGDVGLNAQLEVEPLADAWLQLIRDPDRRKAMGERARKHAVDHFDTALVGPALEAFYKQMLERKSRTNGL
ncbi:MAG: glycosyltransferase family 4 protein [Lentisphaeria bacterium]|nr:glycosyltransferase family 4 protein [Lentisphaeria bacterium]